MAAQNIKIVITDDKKMELIQLWEGEEVLYNVTHRDYHNNNKRNSALKRIAEEMGINVTQVKDVMKSLRTIYLKERRKIDDSSSSGKGAREVYVSKWKFVNELHFLQPYTRPIHMESTMSKSPETDEQLDSEDIEGNENESTLQEYSPTVTPVVSTEAISSHGTRRNLTKKTKKNEDLMMQACDVLASVSKRAKQNKSPATPTPPDDADELFGKMMSRLVKEIPNQMNKEMAKIECQQILFRYRFQTPHQPPIQPQQQNFTPPLTSVYPNQHAHHISSFPTRQPTNHNFCYNSPLLSPTYQYHVDGTSGNHLTSSTRYANLNLTPQEVGENLSTHQSSDIQNNDNVNA